MNKVKYWREKRNLTQNELAIKSGISLRTIQRIEGGSILKGYTLKSIAQALEITIEELITKEPVKSIERAKIVNLSILLGFIIPFGNIIIPLLLTINTKDLLNKQLGKNIVLQQIIISFILSLYLIINPFVQKELKIQYPIFIYGIIAFWLINLIIIISNHINLHKNQKLLLQIKI